MNKEPHGSGQSFRRLKYQGRVQGVGFRYTVRSIAKRFPVTGYVMNLSDGSVELVVQGEEVSVEAFLAEVFATFTGHIEKTDSEDLQSAEACQEFRIRYS